MPGWYELILEILNYIFAVIFNAEAILKILGFGHWYFTSNWWNVFDFVIVLGTNLGIIMRIIGVGVTSTITVIRMFRIMWIMWLTKTYGGMIVNTLINILPQVSNILTLLLLVLFIYSVLGLQLFSMVKTADSYNDFYNFQNILVAMALLFWCATGEDWNIVMFDLTNNEDCINL